MGRWSREEIEEAFEKYQEAAWRSAQSKDWTEWANCFTEDATYIEHHWGDFWGRQRILDWITKTMTTEFPVTHMNCFPISWYTIDEEKGWIICEVMNRMEDLGDGKIYEAPNLTVLHYGGNGLFKYEEDVYNPRHFEAMVTAWIEAKEKLDGKSK